MRVEHHPALFTDENGGGPSVRLVLEAAVNGRADGIVTFNLRDFVSAAEQFGIAVMSPAEAVKRLEKKS